MASTTAKACFVLLILHSFPYHLVQLALALFGSSCLNAALIFTIVLEDQTISNGQRVPSNVGTSIVPQTEFLGSLNAFAFSALMG